jgi:ribosome-associated protein
MRGATVTEAESQPKPAALRLDQFLKVQAIAETGGRAKLLIQGGEVKVNGEIETRRRRKLNAGDIVEVGAQRRKVEEWAG